MAEQLTQENNMQAIKFPIAPDQVEKLFFTPTSIAKRTNVALWGNEVLLEVIVSTCGYGYPSVVIVRTACDAGVTAQAWSGYGNGYPKQQFFYEMLCWITNQLNSAATGAYGLEYSDFCIA